MPPQGLDTAYYFGCAGDKGHFLWDRHLRSINFSSPPLGFPCKVEVLDGGLFPKLQFTPQNGVAFVSRINGWTIISFKDNTVDSRPGSVSVFLVKGLLTFETALDSAKQAFPTIFERFNFEIRLMDYPGVER